MLKIDELQQKYNEAKKNYDNKLEELTSSSNNLSYDEFQEFLEPESSIMLNLDKDIRLLLEPELKELDDIGDLMTLVEFIECVESGGFIDYDGFGEYVKGDKMTGITILPSDVECKKIRTDCDKVMWYNK